MSHAKFIVKDPEVSPYYVATDKPRFEAVRAITTKTRPPGAHGCKVTEIVPGLWTAHYEDFNSKEKLEGLPIAPPVKLLVNTACAYNQCPSFQGFYGPDVQVLQIPLYDDQKEGEPHHAAGDAKQYFRFVNESIKRTIEGGGSALVHCYASISRSVVMILAYLLEVHRMDLLQATTFLKSKWDATWPNDSFVFQLIAFERELNSK